MKLATFTAPGHDEPLAGVVDGERVRAFATGPDAVQQVLAKTLTIDATIAEFALGDIQLLAPIPHPGTIYAIGRNYADHAAEMGGSGDTPQWPTVFVKLSSSVTAPGGPIRCPDVVEQLDYEGELVLVIGTEGRVAGYTAADDVSSRDLQRREPQWVRAKGADTFCPYGPWITTVDEIGEPENLEIRTWVNGELRQESNTKHLIFGIDYILDFLSQTCTLRPGDLILTGTPAGVGGGMKPPQFLKSGDQIRIEIEQLGAIEHAVA
jgi:2-keto-4-pentenoate hydratase/2-oxohepta-3-ene-1,7-dioic acid hydratase in catechol pathway